MSAPHRGSYLDIFVPERMFFAGRGRRDMFRLQQRLVRHYSTFWDFPALYIVLLRVY